MAARRALIWETRMTARRETVGRQLLVTVLAATALTACGHVSATSEDETYTRTVSDFELVEAKDNRDRLTTLNQLKAERRRPTRPNETEH